jgi:hypothetical protein
VEAGCEDVPTTQNPKERLPSARDDLTAFCSPSPQSRVLPPGASASRTSLTSSVDPSRTGSLQREPEVLANGGSRGGRTGVACRGVVGHGEPPLSTGHVILVGYRFQ